MDKTITFRVNDEQAVQADELRNIGINLSQKLRSYFDEIVKQYLPHCSEK